MIPPTRVHRLIYGKESPPTKDQELVYRKEGVRGISFHGRDHKIFETTLALALSQAYEPKKDEYGKVFLFAPVKDQEWVFEQIGRIAFDLTKRVRTYITKDNTEEGKKLLQWMRRWIETIHVGAPITWGKIYPPDHWVSYGHRILDPVPTWIREALWVQDDHHG